MTLRPSYTLTPVGITSAVLHAARQIRHPGWRKAWRWRLAARCLREELALLAAQARRRDWSAIRRFNGWIAEPANTGFGTAAYLAGRGITRRRAVRDLHRRQDRSRA